MRYEKVSGWFDPSRPTEQGSILQHLPLIGKPTDFDVVGLNMIIALRNLGKAPFWSSTIIKFLNAYVRAAGDLRVSLVSNKISYLSTMGGEDTTSLYLDVLISEIEANRVPESMRFPWTVSPEVPELLPNFLSSLGAGKIVVPAIIILGLIALIQVSPTIKAITPRRGV